MLLLLCCLLEKRLKELMIIRLTHDSNLCSCVRRIIFPTGLILRRPFNVFILLIGWICLLDFTQPALSRFSNALKIIAL